VALFVFDLDNTLLKVNSSFKYYSFLQKENVFSKVDLLRALRYLVFYLYFDLSPKKLHEKVFLKFLKDRFVDQIFGKVDIFLEKFLKDFLNERVYFFLEKARKEKQNILLLSNSPDLLVAKIAEKLNIINYRATTYEIDDRGRFVKILKIMDGMEKARFVLKFVKKLKISKGEIFAFTDSIWDRPLLEIAKKAYAVNPDKKLLTLAKAKGWEIL
jgi:HAD superfamily hydrolase (TIGR01490 family)